MSNLEMIYVCVGLVVFVITLVNALNFYRQDETKNDKGSPPATLVVAFTWALCFTIGATWPVSVPFILSLKFVNSGKKN